MWTSSGPWIGWLGLVILALFVLLLLRLLERWFPGALRALPLPAPVINALRVGLRYLPLLLVIWLALRFILIAPAVHGMILALCIGALFWPLQQLFLGWPIRSRLSLQAPVWIQTGDVKGRVRKLRLLGLEIENAEGYHYRNYATLSRVGYSILAPGGENPQVDLILQVAQDTDLPEQERALFHHLSLCPYLDWRIPPEIEIHDPARHQIHLKACLEPGHHQDALLALLEEAGFDRVMTHPFHLNPPTA